jgi:hypothetical protein
VNGVLRNVFVNGVLRNVFVNGVVRSGLGKGCRGT